jgi:hypothetical protein
MVQSILIGYDFSDGVKEYVRKRMRIEEKTVRLLRYVVNERRDDMTLEPAKLD